MSFANPYIDDSPFGRVTIGGVDVPGSIQKVNGAIAKQEWAFQKGTSGNFAVSIWRGALLAEEIEITSRITNGAQYAAAIAFIKVLMPKRGKKVPSFSLVNPDANAVGINRCAVRECSAPVEEAPGKKVYLFTVKICEYNPSKKAPAGQADPAKPPDEPKPADAQEEELQQLLNKARGP